jgi:hypothetical protein
MLWNTLIHSVLGVIGREAFVWSPQAIAGALGIAAAVQGIDMMTVYRRHVALFLASPAGEDAGEVRAFRQGLKIKLPQLYVLKVVWYSCITLLVAAAARALM